MDRWRGKVAVVTGASSGLGAAIVMELVKQGMKVAALARREDRLTKMESDLSGLEGKIKGLKCDVTSTDDIVSAFKWIEDNWGAVHVLINNAGVLVPVKLQNADEDAMRKMFETNVIGLSICAKEALKSMKNHQITEGHIINMNSISGQNIYPFPGLAGYSATKHSVTALSYFLRLEVSVAKLPIRVTSMSPGFCKSEMSDMFTTALPLGESWPMLESSEIADAVILCLAAPPNLNVSEIALQPRGEIQYPSPEMMGMINLM